MKHVLDNLEIYLTFAGLVVIFLAAALFPRYGYWQTFGITALAVGVIHGLLFWTIRRQQRLVRQELVEAIRLMLADRINNNLTILLSAAELQGDPLQRAQLSAGYRNILETALFATQEISTTIDRLSLDSLRRWQRHYQLDVLQVE